MLTRDMNTKDDVSRNNTVGRVFTRHQMIFFPLLRFNSRTNGEGCLKSDVSRNNTGQRVFPRQQMNHCSMLRLNSHANGEGCLKSCVSRDNTGERVFPRHELNHFFRCSDLTRAPTARDPIPTREHVDEIYSLVFDEHNAHQQVTM